MVDVDKSIDITKLPPSARVALRNDSYVLHLVLPSKVDPLVSLMRVEKVPDSTYDMIGGLDQQIKEIKEVGGGPTESRAMSGGTVWVGGGERSMDCKCACMLTLASLPLPHGMCVRACHGGPPSPLPSLPFPPLPPPLPHPPCLAVGRPQVIELPIKHPELFESLGIAQPKGVLLYGPPGTGKTLLARAVAHHTDCTFIRVSGSELVQKYIGEGSRRVRELFVRAR